MGYAWNGNCYETPENALEAFARDVPRVDGVSVNSFAGPPSVDAAGLVTWSIDNRPFSGDAVFTRNGTTQLLTCTFDSFRLDQLSDLAFIGVVLLAFFMGFRSGQAA